MSRVRKNANEKRQSERGGKLGKSGGGGGERGRGSVEINNTKNDIIYLKYGKPERPKVVTGA